MRSASRDGSMRSGFQRGGGQGGTYNQAMGDWWNPGTWDWNPLNSPVTQSVVSAGAKAVGLADPYAASTAPAAPAPVAVPVLPQAPQAKNGMMMPLLIGGGILAALFLFKKR